MLQLWDGPRSKAFIVVPCHECRRLATKFLILQDMPVMKHRQDQCALFISFAVKKIHLAYWPSQQINVDKKCTEFVCVCARIETRVRISPPGPVNTRFAPACLIWSKFKSFRGSWHKWISDASPEYQNKHFDAYLRGAAHTVKPPPANDSSMRVNYATWKSIQPAACELYPAYYRWVSQGIDFICKSMIWSWFCNHRLNHHFSTEWKSALIKIWKSCSQFNSGSGENYNHTTSKATDYSISTD